MATRHGFWGFGARGGLAQKNKRKKGAPPHAVDHPHNARGGKWEKGRGRSLSPRNLLPLDAPGDRAANDP